MKQTLIRYKTTPESADENQRLIENVFDELLVAAPEGLRYMVLRLEDGNFAHLVSFEQDDGAQKINALEAFKAFQKSIKERCVEPPQSSSATIVGNYRMLGE